MRRDGMSMAAAVLTAVVLQSGAAQGKARQADFNGDGYADLAVGVPFTTVLGATNAGEVVILYGSGAGLRVQGSELLNEDSFEVSSTSEQSDLSGSR